MRYLWSISTQRTTKTLSPERSESILNENEEKEASYKSISAGSFLQHNYLKYIV